MQPEYFEYYVTGHEGSKECQHKGRAVGEHFERCLLCRAWRLGSGDVWHPPSIPMPHASEDGETARIPPSVPCEGGYVTTTKYRE